MDTEDYCGMDLFTDFTFEDITKANPPQEKGVYVIKVKKRGLPPDEIISQLTTHIAGLCWEMVQASLTSRIARINNITGCPVIYLGSAGTSHASRHTLAGRYRDLASRHPARYPLFALLYSGWELEYGWKVSDEPKELEAELKKEYRKRRKGKLPALVGR
jgi:hypothetical protein